MNAPKIEPINIKEYTVKQSNYGIVCIITNKGSNYWTEWIR
ncbi:MAG: hypothetical protein ACKPKO_03075 [Candidatus Fonsibacter sp.]